MLSDIVPIIRFELLVGVAEKRAEKTVRSLGAKSYFKDTPCI